MSELEQNLVLNARLLPIFPGPCCEVFANLNNVRPSNKKQHRRCSTFTQPHVKNTHQMPLSGRARKNTDTKRYKTQQNLHRIQRQCHYQEERDKTHVTNLYILQNTKTLASHPTTMPSSGRARAAARLLAPVKTPISST